MSASTQAPAARRSGSPRGPPVIPCGVLSPLTYWRRDTTSGRCRSCWGTDPRIAAGGPRSSQPGGPIAGRGLGSLQAFLFTALWRCSEDARGQANCRLGGNAPLTRVLVYVPITLMTAVAYIRRVSIPRTPSVQVA